MSCCKQYDDPKVGETQAPPIVSWTPRSPLSSEQYRSDKDRSSCVTLIQGHPALPLLTVMSSRLKNKQISKNK
jgi:hypothetical protein